MLKTDVGTSDPVSPATEESSVRTLAGAGDSPSV